MKNETNKTVRVFLLEYDLNESVKSKKKLKVKNKKNKDGVIIYSLQCDGKRN